MQKSVLYAFLMLLVISCQPKKDDGLVTPAPEPEKKCRLVKMIQGTHNGAGEDTTFNFYYDASGKLNKVIELQTNRGTLYSDTVKITHNDAGRLASVIGYRSNYFKYNTNGTLAEATILGWLFDTTRFNYVYATDTVPQKCIRYRRDSYFKTWDTLDMRYTYQNGNIVTIEIFSNGASVGKSNYEYDTIPNLNADLLLMGMQNTVPVGHYEEFLYFNKNAIRKYTSIGSAYTSPYYISYKTDSGRITQSKYSWLKGANFTDTGNVNTRNYFYECL